MGESPVLLGVAQPLGSQPPPSVGALDQRLLELSYKDARRRVLDDFELQYLRHHVGLSAS